jgi:hypothetical protein
MVPMRAPAALTLTLSMMLVAACAQQTPPMPSTCTDTDVAGYERALMRAPGAVRLPGGVAISQCLQKVHSDAELQNLGTIVHTAAERLADRGRGGDRRAALRLGYLSGAVSAGAARSNGISAELARRVENAGVGLADADDPSLPAGVAAALSRGVQAGAARG